MKKNVLSKIGTDVLLAFGVVLILIPLYLVLLGQDVSAHQVDQHVGPVE